MFRRFLKLLPPVIVMAFVACAPPPSRNGSGGTVGDPGGGDFGKSSKEQVMIAIEDAVSIFNLEEFVGGFNVFESLKGMINEKVLTEKTRKQNEILKAVIKKGKHREDFGKSKVSYDMAACPGVEEHKLAAVSAHKIGANLCFDVQQLTQFPPSQLKREIFALIVHEYFHLLGYREEVAKSFQNLLTDNWDRFEFYQLDVSHVHQLHLYDFALGKLNASGFSLVKGELQDAQTKAEVASRALKEIAENIVFLTLGFQMRVGDRLKLRELAMELREKVSDFTYTSYMFSKPISKEALATFFCEVADREPKIRDAMLLKESPFRKEFKANEIILIEGDGPAFECSGILPERYKVMGRPPQPGDSEDANEK